jgi:hypothetical protein
MIMAIKELTTDECMEIFKKYDKKTYDYYNENMWYFGYNARNYAEKLKEEHEQ